MQDRSSAHVTIERVRDAASTTVRDVVAVEEPMEIRVVAGGESHRVAVTMRTPGHDFELAAGFLLSEGLIGHREDLVDVSYCPDVDDVQNYNVVQVTLASGTPFDASLLDRNFFATSSCGVCGKGSLEALRTYCAVVGSDGLRFDGAMLRGLPAKLREAQAVFEATGGLHATGLFTASGDLVTMREDVGRHNAFDKVVGHHFMAGDLPLSEHLTVVSGRASWELMQKAAAAGVPVVAAIGAPSSLAIDLATEFGMTLAGFTHAGGFNIYAGAERIHV